MCIFNLKEKDEEECWEEAKGTSRRLFCRSSRLPLLAMLSVGGSSKFCCCLVPRSFTNSYSSLVATDSIDLTLTLSSITESAMTYHSVSALSHKTKDKLQQSNNGGTMLVSYVKSLTFYRLFFNQMKINSLLSSSNNILQCWFQL